MKQRTICKTLAVAVILIFIGMGIQPSVAVQPETEIEQEPSGLLWGTYRNCEIDGELVAGTNMIWPPPFPLCGFISLVVIGFKFSTCKLSGHKGIIPVKAVIGFGFIGEILPSYQPRDKASIYGHLLFCIYIKDF